MRFALLVAALIAASMPAVTAPSMAQIDWRDRRIEFAQVVPRPPSESRSEPEIAQAVLAPEPKSGGMPHFLVILAFLSFLLIFATIEIVLCNDEQQK